MCQALLLYVGDGNVITLSNPIAPLSSELIGIRDIQLYRNLSFNEQNFNTFRKNRLFGLKPICV